LSFSFFVVGVHSTKAQIEVRVLSQEKETELEKDMGMSQS